MTLNKPSNKPCNKPLSKPSPFSFSGRVVAAAAAATLIANTATVATIYLSDQLWLGWLLGSLLGLLFVSSVLHGWLGQKQQLIQALSNGIDNFAERQFSTSIHVKGRDELADLARAQNRLGEVLRREHQSIYQRELLLDTVMQAAPTAIVLCDQNSRVVYSNHAARDLLNRGQGLNGHSLAQCLQHGPAAFKQALQQEKNGLFTLDDAQQNTFHLTASRFTLNTKIHRLYLIKQLTQEISRQEVQVWKKVIRLISHEINNSLAPICSLAHSGLKLINTPKIDTLQQVFNTIGERAEHLNTFIQGYAHFAKLPAPQSETVGLQRFFISLQQLCNFELKWQTALTHAVFDPAQIQQVLLNLLRNAQESGSPIKDICLVVSQVTDTLQIVVEDGGPGMSQTHFHNALLPFYSTKKSGTGLGLALCREIVDAHNGYLTLANKPGGGLRVSVSLPLKIDP